jgi:hypothetical protein
MPGYIVYCVLLTLYIYISSIFVIAAHNYGKY